MNELKQQQIYYFWTLYEIEGIHKAMNWLDTQKYYEDEDSCRDDITKICKKLDNLSV